GTLTLNGTMNITGGGISNFGGTLINNGTINKSVVESTVSSIDVPLINNASGIIKGAGTLDITGLFTNDGTIAPGNPVGILAFNQAQPFSANSILAIELLNNSGPGSGHDQMKRNSDLTLNGTLTVNELAVLPLSSFTIIELSAGLISGNFTTVNLPAGYTMTIGSTTVILNKITIVPLRLLSFQVTKSNNQTFLNWSTENEINTSHFEIERSADGRVFNKIGNIRSNNLPGNNNYHFTDQLPLQPTNYYRIKQVDIDGDYSYSETKEINFERSPVISVSPNPSKNILSINGAENYEEIQIINISGLLLRKMKSVGNIQVDISNLPAGKYFLKLSGKTGSKTVQFVKL
ncbi:MAG: T9SS type A sorting domain-containing protein, partial [Ferruginibacter sp.]|nr:T9SS type A sorting domain-containing protein [Ferruginibacter sp.]